ncbi:MAG: phosphodiester glycosidase family protein [Pseudomonadota bacterium]
MSSKFYQFTLFIGLLIATLMPKDVVSAAQPVDCHRERHARDQYTVCIVDPSSTEIRLFLYDGDGRVYGEFEALASDLDVEGTTLLLAVNGGMYHDDRSAVGLYVEDGQQLSPLNRREAAGNFHMLPNGVFFVGSDGAAQVVASDTYAASGEKPEYATQSGPMLVIEGAIHPRFIQGSDSRKRRNGVGVRADGKIVFAISERVVTFYDFATLFRDELGCSNALFLDGTISRLYAPSIGRRDLCAKMGPIIGVIAKTEQ